MKTYTTSLSLLLLILASAAQAATLLTYDRLEAGSNNSFGSQTTTSGMLAVGNNNTVSQEGASAMGIWNNVAAKYALAVGSFNSVMGASYGVSGMVAIGHGNSSYGPNSVVIGQNNTLTHDWEFGGGYSSLIAGGFHYILGNYSFVTGMGNQIPMVYDYDGDVHIPQSVALLGSSLICRHDHCTVVGKNNISLEPTVPPSTPSPLFVVGNGPSASIRSNALEVLDNGNMTVQGVVTCAPGGDIPMFTGN